MSACCKCGYDSVALVFSRWMFFSTQHVNSGNARVHNVGASRWKYKAERDLWAAQMTAARLKHRIPVAKSKRRVTLTRAIGKGQRAFDRDNLATGCKPIVDAMVSAGLLIGDRPNQVEIHYAQERSETGVGGLHVLLEELPCEPCMAGNRQQAMAVGHA